MLTLPHRFLPMPDSSMEPRRICRWMALAVLVCLLLVRLAPHGVLADLAIWVGILNAMLLPSIDLVLGVLLEGLRPLLTALARPWTRLLLVVLVATALWCFAIFLLPLALACRHLRGPGVVQDGRGDY